jgi:hypothetical protein
VVFTVVHRVTGHADLSQLLLEGVGAGEGAGGEGLEVEALDETLRGATRQVGDDGLARRRAVQRTGLADGGIGGEEGRAVER